VKNTLKTQGDFQRVYSQKNIIDTRYIRLYSAAAKDTVEKTAVVASKKCGNAIQRNKAKRRLRALYQQLKKEQILNTPKDLVFIAKKELLTVSFETLYQDIKGRLS